MRKSADTFAPPSPRLLNYCEFKGKHLTDEERSGLFNGNPVFLRQVADLATLPTHPTEPLLEDKAS